MIIEPIDPLAAPEHEARACYQLSVDVARELTPEDPLPTWDEHVASLRNRPSWRHLEHFVAWDATRSAVLGVATAEWETGESNLDLGGFDIAVRADARRRGVGRRLLSAALAVLEREGRTKVYSGAWEGSPGEPFLAAAGLEPKLRDRTSRCYVKDIDRAMLAGWISRAGERAGGYSLVAWEGPCPEEHLERFVEILHVMNTAPLESFEMDDEIITVDMVREHDRLDAARGTRTFACAARHDETGAFVGLTAIKVGKWHPEAAEQEATCTDPAHRNKGIGRWLKAVNALRVLDACPDVEFIDTWNAGSNRAMLAINEAMGFRPLRYWNNYQAPLGVVTERLAAAATN